MSGIYIPNIKPPTACCACPCSYDNQCAVKNEYPTFAEWYEDKPDWCPLIPVPDHGRLIDADALCKVKGISNVAIGYINRAPTIIPASEEVYDKYTDTAGNIHWTGTHSGKHIIPADKEGKR